MELVDQGWKSAMNSASGFIFWRQQGRPVSPVYSCVPSLSVIKNRAVVHILPRGLGEVGQFCEFPRKRRLQPIRLRSCRQSHRRRSCQGRYLDHLALTRRTCEPELHNHTFVFRLRQIGLNSLPYCARRNSDAQTRHYCVSNSRSLPSPSRPCTLSATQTTVCHKLAPAPTQLEQQQTSERSTEVARGR
jgi:hypothetical protein